MNLKDIHVGDTVKVHNRSDNIAHKVGLYELLVVSEDDHSFAVAVKSFDKWWFYRDTGESYTGDAVVITYQAAFVPTQKTGRHS